MQTPKSMSSPAPGEPRRTAYIDHVRVVLTVLVVLLHTSITYGGPGGWFLQEVRTESLDTATRLGFLVLNSSAQAMTMALFFLIAGYFTAQSLARKGARWFVRDRFIRLGIPLAAFVLFVGQVTSALANTTRGYSFPDTMRYLYTHLFYNPGHLWFVQALLMFSLIWVGWRHFVPDSPKSGETTKPSLPRHRTIALALAAVGAMNFLVRQVAPVGWSVLGYQLALFPVYFLMFFYGCHAARDRLLERIDWPFVRPWAVVALVLSPVLAIAFYHAGAADPFLGGFNRYSLIYSFWDPFFGFGANLALLHGMRSYFNKTHGFLDALGRGSYGAYCLHATVLVSLTLLFQPWQAHPLFKFVVVGGLTLITSYSIAFLFMRTPGLRRVF